MKFQALVAAASVATTLAHGHLSSPRSRTEVAFQAGQDYCPHCTLEDVPAPPGTGGRSYPGSRPFAEPGKATLTMGPCGINGGNNYNAPARSWGGIVERYEAGQTISFTSCWQADHKGAYSMRVCPDQGLVNKFITPGVTPSSSEMGALEQCFQANVLPCSEISGNGNRCNAIAVGSGCQAGWGCATNTDWFYSPISGAFRDSGCSTGFGTVDTVRLPAGLSSNHTLLSWRWDALDTSQLYTGCVDVSISGNGSPPSPTLTKRHRKLLYGSVGASPTPKPTTKSPTKSPTKPPTACTPARMQQLIATHKQWNTFVRAGSGSFPVDENSIRLNERLDCDNCLTNPVLIPAELGLCMGNLKLLRLSGSAFTGPIPAELGQLRKLEKLFFTLSQLTGPIPAELGQLGNLQYLEVSNSRMITGSIPAELGQLANLQELRLLKTQLTGPIPAELGQLANLIKLHLFENQLTGPIPAELGRLNELKELNFQKNQLTGPIPAELGRLEKLQRLDLGFNGLTGIIPAELGQLRNMVFLHLVGNQLTDKEEAKQALLAKLPYCKIYV